ncbi:acyl-CoA thioesterase [Actinomycetospora soli]|uniref:acyl-CoA thioesterase n=1 Tax=Actinomycetospora soli TaxID=2893887 RepID=UPI001E5A3006|nr:thioesterase family protein [Actinomycetospora soli]MCD2185773.1 acyl-CoA thioesterase [Actinomycetospora soli]
MEWHDTDAAGHQHHSAVLRWVEAAEAELLRSVGCARLFGRTPRVRHEVDYRSRVFFGDEVETTLRVEALGRSSLTYAFDVACSDRPVASGRLVIVHAPSATGGAEPWPEDVRAALGPIVTATPA